jgi:CRP/FNR family transcriptional regulator, anaerobic regulatory protein
MARLEPAVARALPFAGLGNPCAACEIREIGVCGSLSGEELEELRRIIKESNCAEGRTVFSEGDPAENLYNVVAGAVRLSKLLPDGRRQITGFVFPGDFLGIAFNDTYAYSAEAIVPTRLCRFPRGSMERLVKSIRNLEHRLLGEAANELVAAQDQMLLLGRKTAKERVASFLIGLTERARRRGRRDNPIAVPMSRTDIADYLGLTTETVSRSFTRLKSANIIRLEPHGMVAILDREALAELAEGGIAD